MLQKAQLLLIALFAILAVVAIAVGIWVVVVVSRRSECQPGYLRVEEVIDKDEQTQQKT